MVLTPADVHNVAFSRPRIGKRGYDEQEVDLFVDPVEQELIRHLAEEGELRGRWTKLRNRYGEVQQLEAEFSQREAALNQQESELAQRAAQVAKRGAPLPQQLAQLRHREAQAGRREAQLAQHAAELGEREAELARWENELRRREAELEQRSQRPAQQLRAVPNAAHGVNGAPLDELRSAASAHGRHDMERMAIRAVTDPLENTVTETVHERTRRSHTDDRDPGASAERSVELERLREQNAELTHSLRLLKSAAALLAAALDRS
jgi:DivIVA domain-containing protein